MKPLRAVLLVGSAKPSGTSTSESLGRFLFDRLDRAGVATSTLTVDRSASGRDRRLVAAVAAADVFVLSTPLYVDSFPALVIRSLEAIAADRQRGARRRCGFAVIVNCGFPEASQCDTVLAMARLFARRAGFEWMGGLALGEGGTIDGKHLEAFGGVTKQVRAALDLAAAALAEGQAIPAEAVARMARRMLPQRIYTIAATIDWRRRAVRHGVPQRQLRARPFEM